MVSKLVPLLRRDGTCGEHVRSVSRPSELVFVLDLSLTCFHSVAVGFIILCSRHWILVNLNASRIAFTFIEL